MTNIRNKETNSIEQLRYNSFLKQWRKDHEGPKFQGMEPPCFQEWLSNERAEYCVYYVEVTIEDASHSILEYTERINVLAPKGLTMDELKDYINYENPFSIEEEVDPQVDVNDAVNVEVYDYNLTLLEIREEN